MSSSSGAAGHGGETNLGGALSGLGGAACEAPISRLPNLTSGRWLICGATDTNGRIWTGVLTLDRETPTCDGSELAGNFHWLSTNLGTTQGDTLCKGSYNAVTQHITLNEYQVTGGAVVTGVDRMVYDAASDELTTGAWTCGCAPGMWSAATRIAAEGNTTCP